MLPLTLAAFGCARGADGAHALTPAQVSASAPAHALYGRGAAAPRVDGVRVLGERVNMREPLRVDAQAADVSVSFGVGQRAGAVVALDPASLEARRAEPRAFAPHGASTQPPYLPLTPARVLLEGGGTLECWNDDASSRVFVQAYDASGAARGEPVAIAVDGRHAFGAPRAATVDGRHVVVAFFASDATGCALVAASVEVPSARPADTTDTTRATALAR